MTSSTRMDFSMNQFVIPILSLLATGVVFYKSCIDNMVVSMDSPNFLLVVFSTFPYLLTFGISFFAKNDSHRKALYATLGILIFMTSFEWMGPRTPDMKNLYSVVWFIQIVFLVPFLIYTIREKT